MHFIDNTNISGNVNRRPINDFVLHIAHHDSSFRFFRNWHRDVEIDVSRYVDTSPSLSDVITLRKEHRIVGSLVGTCPKKKIHTQRNWLPLLLMKEEAKLLIEKGIAQLVRSPEKIAEPLVIESYYDQRDKLCEEQIVLMKEKRKRQIMEKADEIYEGKKRKYMQSLKTQALRKTSEIVSTQDVSEMQESKSNDKNLPVEGDQEKKDHIALITAQTSNDSLKASEGLDKEDKCDFLSKEAVIEAELAKVPEVDKKLCMVQLFSECPWKNTSTTVNLEYPSTEMEKLRYAVFKDLWEKSYYITGGMKFGGDFLVYKGDPIKYHAVFIVVCIPRSRKMTGFDIITHGRLGKQVKKTIAFAQVDLNGVLHYCCTAFAGDLK